jgi:hypothetical protein
MCSGGGRRGWREVRKKAVLFCKKEPKNFCPLVRALGLPARVQAVEVFFASFFFRKKKSLAWG